MDSSDTRSAHTPDALRGNAAATVQSELIEVVAELSFESPTTHAALAGIRHSCEWCFRTHRVQLTRLLVSRHGKRAVLLFRAPDAESVRLACQQARLPFERVWPCG